MAGENEKWLRHHGAPKVISEAVRGKNEKRQLKKQSASVGRCPVGLLRLRAGPKRAAAAGAQLKAPENGRSV